MPGYTPNIFNYNATLSQIVKLQNKAVRVITDYIPLMEPIAPHYLSWRPLKFVKLQNKAIRVVNDIPLMEPIAPHCLSWRPLKFPDTVKLNTRYAILLLFPPWKVS